MAIKTEPDFNRSKFPIATFGGRPYGDLDAALRFLLVCVDGAVPP